MPGVPNGTPGIFEGGALRVFSREARRGALPRGPATFEKVDETFGFGLVA